MIDSAGEGGWALLAMLRAGAPDALSAGSGPVLYIGSYLVLQLGLIRGDGWLYPTAQPGRPR